MYEVRVFMHGRIYRAMCDNKFDAEFFYAASKEHVHNGDVAIWNGVTRIVHCDIIEGKIIEWRNK